MKRVLCCLLAALLLFTLPVAAGEDAPVAIAENAPPNAPIATKCKAALLMEADTGEILYEKSPTEHLPIASVTKIMTLLLTMEALDGGTLKLEDTVTVSDYAASMGGSQAYMEPGETLSVHDMLKAVVVSSANDGAVALAEHLAGSESAFVEKMNRRAAELGMTDTLFCNPTGLDDNCDPYSCARDVALMSRELLKHGKILEYTTIWTDSIRGGAFGLANTNKLVRFYTGANGLKTGSTAKAKFCVSAAAKRDGMQLIAVVLGGESSAERFDDAKAMLNYGFATYAVYDPGSVSTEPIPVWGGKEDKVAPLCPAPKLLVEKGLKPEITSRVEIATELNAPVAKEQIIGKIVYEAEGKVIRELPITARNAVEKADASFIFHRLLAYFLFSQP